MRLVHLRELLTGVHEVLGHLVAQILLLETHLGDGGEQAPVPHVLQVHEVLGDGEHEDDGAQGHEEHGDEGAGAGEVVGDGGDVDVGEDVADVDHCSAFSLS